MSNLSILQQNILHALGCDIAGKAFLRACDRSPVFDAERYAFEVRDIVRLLEPALAKASELHRLEFVPDGLLQFVLERHRNWRFPPAANRHVVEVLA